MQNDAVTIGRLLKTLTRRQRRLLIENLKQGSGAYGLSWNGKYQRLASVSARHVRVREIEELFIPTVQAGRVPIDEARFVTAMRQLDFSPERILGVLADGAADSNVLESSGVIRLLIITTILVVLGTGAVFFGLKYLM